MRTLITGFILLCSLAISASEQTKLKSKDALRDFVFVVANNSGGINTIDNWSALHNVISEISGVQVADSLLNPQNSETINKSIIRIMSIRSSAQTLALLTSDPIILGSETYDGKTVVQAKPYDSETLPVYEITCSQEDVSGWFGIKSIEEVCRVSSIHFNTGEVALVIIDMQPVYMTLRGGNPDEPSNAKKLKALFKNQIQAVEIAKAFNQPIIVVETSGLGRTDQRILNALEDYDRAYYFEKNKNGMLDFGSTSSKALIHFFNENDINEVVVMGANGGACVRESIWGAISLGNIQVSAFTNGIADFNYESYIYPYSDRYKEDFPLRFYEINDINVLNALLDNHTDF